MVAGVRRVNIYLEHLVARWNNQGFGWLVLGTRAHKGQRGLVGLACVGFGILSLHALLRRFTKVPVVKVRIFTKSWLMAPRCTSGLFPGLILPVQSWGHRQRCKLCRCHVLDSEPPGPKNGSAFCLSFAKLGRWDQAAMLVALNVLQEVSSSKLVQFGA